MVFQPMSHLVVSEVLRMRVVGANPGLVDNLFATAESRLTPGRTLHLVVLSHWISHPPTIGIKRPGNSVNIFPSMPIQCIYLKRNTGFLVISATMGAGL